MEPKELRDQLKSTPFEELRLQLPSKLAAYHPTGEGNQKTGGFPNSKTVDFLKALVEFAPNTVVQQNVTIEILSCATNACLENLARYYWEALIVPIRAGGGKTPPISDHPSRPSADFDSIIASYRMDPSKCDRKTMRELVLFRENYKCAITGRLDGPSVSYQKVNASTTDIVSRVESAHILPFSLIPGSNGLAVLDRSGTIWRVISAYSGISLDDLNGDQINRPENGMALDSYVHWLFGEFSICLEPTPKPNVYKVRTWERTRNFVIPETVSFVSRRNIGVPDPRYLALHAACAKVVHASGMAEILQKILDDLEQTVVLSSDGSSAQLLHHALSMVAVQ